MTSKIQNLFNFVHDNIGKDSSIVGLCGLKKQHEYIFVEVPKELKNTFIQNTENNYLLI